MKLREFRKIIRSVVLESKVKPPTKTVNIDEALKLKITTLIRESLDEIKKERETSIHDDMEDLTKSVKSINSNYSIAGSTDGVPGSYELCDCVPHHFEIRPKHIGCYDVVYFRDESDRVKKIGLKFEELKKFITEKLKDKSENYTNTANSKSVENAKDVTKKSDGLPKTDVNKVKEVKDSKNEAKDYTEKEVKKDDDLPDKPMKPAETKKLSDHPIKDNKPKFSYPKQGKKEKNHVVKGGTGKVLNLPEKKIKSK